MALYVDISDFHDILWFISTKVRKSDRNFVFPYPSELWKMGNYFSVCVSYQLKNIFHVYLVHAIVYMLLCPPPFYLDYSWHFQQKIWENNILTLFYEVFVC